jgi:hypothetical protein
MIRVETSQDSFKSATTRFAYMVFNSHMFNATEVQL